MDFIAKIQKRLQLNTKYKMAMALGTTPQQYDSLLKANDRIRLRDLVALRHISGLTDTELLDMIEKKVKEMGFNHKPDLEAIRNAKPGVGKKEKRRK